MSDRKTRVFIDPDGTLSSSIAVHLLVKAPTGVVYGTQCNGICNEVRWAEGFLVPVADRATGEALQNWFVERFGAGISHEGPFRTHWSPQLIEELQAIIEPIKFWFDDGSGDRPTSICFDRDRLNECLEGWVPVKTAFGDAVLLFANSD